MTKRLLSLALLLPSLLLVACQVETVLAQQAGVDGAATVEQLLAQIDRELTRLDTQTSPLRQYLGRSNDWLNQRAPELRRYTQLRAESEARRDALAAQGQQADSDAVVNRWNNEHLPRSMALLSKMEQQAQNHQRVEQQLVKLNARRLELVSQRTRLQLGRSRIKERLEELGSSEEGRKRIFDATGGLGGRVRTPGVPDVGPAGPVTPPPSPRP